MLTGHINKREAPRVSRWHRAAAGVLLAMSLAAAVTREGAAARVGGANLVCPPASQALDGVWGPKRLRVIHSCQRANGWVTDVDREPDGDLHIELAVDPRFRYLLNRANYKKARGKLVVEFMPRDAGHLPAPHRGDRLVMIGAWVLDTSEAWAELHPVWYVRINRNAGHTSGPQFGGSPALAGPHSAGPECLTQSGAVCKGYR